MTHELLWISVPIFLLGLTLTPVLIVRLIKIVTGNDIATVPLLPEQLVDLKPGKLALIAESPTLLFSKGQLPSTTFSRLKYELCRHPERTPVQLNAVSFGATTSGYSKARLSLYTFELNDGGPFQLNIAGLSDTETEDDLKLVFAYAKHGNLAATIVGLVFAAIATMGGLTISLSLYLNA